jgi:hypothetical protein
MRPDPPQTKCLGTSVSPSQTGTTHTLCVASVRSRNDSQSHTPLPWTVALLTNYLPACRAIRSPYCRLRYCHQSNTAGAATLRNRACNRRDARCTRQLSPTPALSAHAHVHVSIKAKMRGKTSPANLIKKVASPGPVRPSLPLFAMTLFEP